MGTRSLTRVFDDHNPSEVLVCMYGQYDGFPDSHGKELAEFISKLTMVNGLGERGAPVANGAGCLAAQIVKNFKSEAGGFYLVSAESYAEEFNYEVRPQGAGKPVNFVVKDSRGEVLYEGTVQEVLAKLEA